jgi:hypothetical protein
MQTVEPDTGFSSWICLLGRPLDVLHTSAGTLAGAARTSQLPACSTLPQMLLFVGCHKVKSKHSDKKFPSDYVF